jgi:hypothetical protein
LPRKRPPLLAEIRAHLHTARSDLPCPQPSFATRAPDAARSGADAHCYGDLVLDNDHARPTGHDDNVVVDNRPAADPAVRVQQNPASHGRTTVPRQTPVTHRPTSPQTTSASQTSIMAEATRFSATTERACLAGSKAPAPTTVAKAAIPRGRHRSTDRPPRHDARVPPDTGPPVRQPRRRTAGSTTRDRQGCSHGATRGSGWKRALAGRPTEGSRASRAGATSYQRRDATAASSAASTADRRLRGLPSLRAFCFSSAYSDLRTPASRRPFLSFRTARCNRIRP